MLAKWFERGGLGQIVAPDDKVKSGTEEKRDDGFWSVVAPYPRASPPPPSSAVLPPVAAPSNSEQPRCVHCNALTPATLSTPSPRGMTAMTPDNDNDNRSNLEALVLSAAKDTAESMMSPRAVAEQRDKFFRLCASAKPLTDKTSLRLKRMLEKNASLVNARASRLGDLVPDSYTPLMAAAKANNVVAAEIILQTSPDSVNDVDTQGRTALHIAAYEGCVEMVDLLKNRHAEGPEAPLDLTGHTPLGRATMSQQWGAKENLSQLKEKLFSPGDASICGRPTPAKARSCQLDFDIMFGHSEMPGFRVMMEDAISFHTFQNATSRYALFGVCDGHGDEGQVSSFVANEVASILQNELSAAPDDIEAAWTTTCLALDAKLKNTGRKGGSTAVWALVTESSIVVANVGDSRCILIQKPGIDQAMQQLTLQDNMTEHPICIDGEAQPVETKTLSVEEAKSFIVSPLSQDHKPHLEVEKARIEKAGLTVTAEIFVEAGEECTIHKVQRSETDRLAVSRAFGDHEYKANDELPANEQAVVAVPDVQVHVRDKDRDMFLVLACDGVWDVMSAREVGEFVVNHVEEEVCEGTEDILPRVGDMLLNECLRRGSTDNMTAVIVALSEAANKLAGSHFIKGRSLDFQEKRI